MKTVSLASGGPATSVIGLGTAYTIADIPSDAMAIAIIRRALDLGITLFDTANVYGLGKAEERLGKALAGLVRDRLTIVSKVYFPMGSSGGGLSVREILTQCEASLRRLQTDYIDFYLCHRWDSEVPLDETLGAFERLVSQGKVRRAGFCEWPVESIRDARKHLEGKVLATSSPQYSLLWRKPEEALFDLCLQTGIRNIVWGVLAEGVLTGKYRPASPPAPGARVSSRTSGQTIGRFLDQRSLRAVADLATLASQHGLTCAQLAVAWALHHPAVDACLVGASQPLQLDELAVAAELTLSADVCRSAENLTVDVVRR